MANSLWDEANKKRLTSLWATDKPASKIAAEMGQGLTKNAIISKAIRMGLPSRGGRCDDPEQLMERKKRKSETDVRAQRIRRGSPITLPQKTLAPPPAPNASGVEPLNLTFDQIGKLHCRWITNEDMSAPLYCGHHVAGETSWCERHKSVVMPPRRELSEEEIMRRRTHGTALGFAQVARRRSGGLRFSAAMPVE